MNDLKNWRKRNGAKVWCDLAERLGTSKNYLYQISGGFRTPSPKLALRIEEETKHLSGNDFVKKESLIFNK